MDLHVFVLPLSRPNAVTLSRPTQCRLTRYSRIPTPLFISTMQVVKRKTTAPIMIA